MKQIKKTLKLRERRKIKTRAKIGKGTGFKPRFSIFRSNKHIYVQLIDDQTGYTLAHASSLEIGTKRQTKIERAREVGRIIAQKVKQLNISQVVFDRGWYKYHGRVKALIEEFRKNLKA